MKQTKQVKLETATFKVVWDTTVYVVHFRRVDKEFKAGVWQSGIKVGREEEYIVLDLVREAFSQAANNLGVEIWTH
jgi:hypothetical protein